MAGRYLAVLENGYRGAVEVQFADLLYLCRGLHHQLGGMDVALRGSAVTFAVAFGPNRPLRIGATVLDALPERRCGLRLLMAAGVTVYVDEPDLRCLGLPADRLVPGVTCLDTTDLAGRWADYEGVWFL